MKSPRQKPSGEKSPGEKLDSVRLGLFWFGCLGFRPVAFHPEPIVSGMSKGFIVDRLLMNLELFYYPYFTVLRPQGIEPCESWDPQHVWAL